MVNWFKKLSGQNADQASVEQLWQAQEFLVLDLELTGLEADTDLILSAGWVAITQGKIRLASAQYFLLNATPEHHDAVGIHLITDQDLLEHGVEADEVVDELTRALYNRILVVHHAPVDIPFLNKIYRQLDKRPPEVPVLDTLLMEQNLAGRRQQVLRDDGLRLAACRERYGLPDYGAHDALTDALATAELLLAQIAHMGNQTTQETLLRLGQSPLSLETANDD